MNREDALLYFPYEEEDDLNDLFEERLFEFKQKLMTIAPSRKLFDIQLSRFSKISDAYLYLSDTVDSNDVVEFSLIHFEDELAIAWKAYNESKNQLKLLLNRSESLNEIRQLVNLMLENMIRFTAPFELLNLKEDVNSVLLSKEPDPMEISAAIQKFNEAGFHKISEIKQLDSNNILFQEAIRLSLWSKKEKHVG